MPYKKLPQTMFLLLLLALTACGGNEDAADIRAVEFSPADRAALAGEWFYSPTYFYVPSSESWNYIWAQRLDNIDCSRTANRSACASPSPPNVDFSQYGVVVIYFGYAAYFTNRPNHIRIISSPDETKVEFQATSYFGPPPPGVAAESEFFLLPKSNKRVTISPAGGA